MGEGGFEPGNPERDAVLGGGNSYGRRSRPLVDSEPYYAMFHAAEALPVKRGRRFRKHSGVHAAFGQEFAKSGELDPKLHRWLLDAFDLRAQGDQGTDLRLSEVDVLDVIEHADEFLAEARRLLGT